jgi:exopolyphosphatase/guanosine-5'-triphosphate,3'-diphosphate pyrophosphatase
MKIGLKFSAIDIGSNAVRLLLSEVFEVDRKPCFKKISLIRMPIRLGEDAFLRHRIGDAKIDQLVQSMIGFKHLMAAYQPIGYLACATSAMREAENREAVCRRIGEQSGIDVQVISGKEEADIIFSNGKHQSVQDSDADGEVFIDVGGGSTEITILIKNQRISRSFNLGTIRVMQDMVASLDWDQMKQWIKEHTGQYKNLAAIGSGGNIHKILKLSRGKAAESISLKQMKKVRRLLKAHTVAERITKLGLKPDRADVILPALKIYHSVMKWGQIPLIRVPQMGLADGLVRQLYFNHRQQYGSMGSP